MPNHLQFRYGNNLVPALLLLTFFIISFLIYAPGLSGSFIVDDIQTLEVINQYGGVTNSESFLSFVFSSSSGPLGRPVSMLSFLINDQFWPGDAGAYKHTNIMIHLLCGICIFLFLNTLLKPRITDEKTRLLICTFTTGLWLTQPLNVSTTLYVIQRMTQLMTLFTLIALSIYIFGRHLQARNAKLSYVVLTFGVMPFIALAVLSKENGILAFLYILVIEFTLLHNLPKHKWFNFWLSVFVVLPIVALCGYLIFSWNAFSTTYLSRDFTLYERLLTEARVVIYYLYQILVPKSGGTGLFHDDFVNSAGLFSPISTALSILLIIALICLAFIKRQQFPILSFSILWYFSGHLLESTFIPLEIYFEHRNYLPMLGPLLGLVFYIFSYLDKTDDKKIRMAIYAAPSLLLIISALFTHQSATLWGNTFNLTKIWAIEHPDSLRAQRVYGQMLAVHNQPQAAVNQLQATYEKFKHDISIPISIHNIACKNGIPAPYAISDISNNVSAAKFSGNLIPAVKNLMELNYTGKCTSMSYDELHRLLHSLEELQNFRAISKAELLVIHSELYVKEGLLSPAVEILDRALSYEHSSLIPARQAQLLLSAGLYEDAMNYINKAKRIENRRTFYKTSDLRFILFIESQIKNALNTKKPDHG